MRRVWHKLRQMTPLTYRILQSGLQLAAALLFAAVLLLWRSGGFSVHTVTAFRHAVSLNYAALTVLFLTAVASAFVEEHS